MSKYASEKIRNIVLVGHGAVGKTTLADQMLFKAGVGSRAGSVDDGTSQLDTDEEEVFIGLGEELIDDETEWEEKV